MIRPMPTMLFSFLAFSLLSPLPAIAQSNPGIGAYPSPPLGQPAPPRAPSRAPMPGGLDHSAQDYCLKNPAACANRPPTAPEVMQQQQKDAVQREVERAQQEQDTRYHSQPRK